MSIIIICFKLVHEFLQIELIIRSVGPGFCDKMFQRWHFIFILLVVFLGVLAVSYLAVQQMDRRAAEWKARVPPIPIAFTGRKEEIQQIADCIVQKDVSIVSVTGGPAPWEVQCGHSC